LGRYISGDCLTLQRKVALLCAFAAKDDRKNGCAWRRMPPRTPIFSGLSSNFAL
jgi:hypothetical protein